MFLFSPQGISQELAGTVLSATKNTTLEVVIPIQPDKVVRKSPTSNREKLLWRKIINSK
jgi:hypothetical protein